MNDTMSHVIENYNKTGDYIITACLLNMLPSEVRYILRINKINPGKKINIDRKVQMYKKHRGKHLHRQVMENFLGRPLLKDEHVHHIDFNKTNNNISNLVVVTPKEHLSISWQANLLLSELIKKGIVEFDKDRLSYYIK